MFFLCKHPMIHYQEDPQSSVLSGLYYADWFRRKNLTPRSCRIWVVLKDALQGKGERNRRLLTVSEPFLVLSFLLPIFFESVIASSFLLIHSLLASSGQGRLLLLTTKSTWYTSVILNCLVWFFKTVSQIFEFLWLNH